MPSSTDIKITSITSAPAYLTPEEHDAATSTTPDSFSTIAPRLVLGLEDVKIYARPTLAGIQTAKGKLWVTEESLSYLPSTSQGFSLPYPLIALHAISPSLPSELASEGPSQCIYCQVDDAGADQAQENQEDDEDAAEEEMGLREMWIVPKESEAVEPLFSALSHCASLHPSTTEDGDEDGNPFASMGPFGTGIDVDRSLQFEDAEEEGEGGTAGAGLSDTGRTQLARLEAMLIGDGSEYDAEEDMLDARATTPEEAELSSPLDSLTLTNVLLLASHPQPLPSLFSPPLLQSLLALLDAYAPVVGWDPDPEEGRMRVVFDDRSPSSDNGRAATESSDSILALNKIVQTLHDLPLETTEHHQGPKPTLTVNRLPRVDINSLLPSQLSAGLPSLIAPSAAAAPSSSTTSAFRPTDHLLPPNTDRNFLISPPGSPPIGWEPIKEDPPNRETLAVDLMEALRKLGREMGASVDEDENQKGNSVTVATASTIQNGLQMNVQREGAGRPSEVQIVVPPSHRRLPSLSGGESPLIPAVTVQVFDDDDDTDNKQVSSSSSSSGVDGRRMKPDITQVRATVDALRGPTDTFDSAGQGGGNRITPTGRPPLA